MSQAELRRLFAARAHTFFFAARFLPPERRHAVTALYAFCRAMDDLADELPASDATPALDSWDAWLAAVERGDWPGAAPPLPLPRCGPGAGGLLADALKEVVRRYAVPVRYLRLLVSGVRSDTTRHVVLDFCELRAYCFHVAGTVGLAMCHILGATSDEAYQRAERLGIAMQLTNVLRDVGEDVQRGRVYLPQDEMARFGVSQSDLEQECVGEPFVALMKHQVSRARTFYAAGLPGVSLLPRESRLPILVAGRLYGAILDRIEAQGYDVFSRRAATSRWSKALVAAHSSVTLWRPPLLPSPGRRLSAPLTEGSLP